jgi:hypothetical protein
MNPRYLPVFVNLLELGGFDDALDTGPPLPGRGDLDIFYRLVRRGYPLIREPKLLIYQQQWPVFYGRWPN